MKAMVFRVTPSLAGVYHLLPGAAFYLMTAGALSASSKPSLGNHLDFDTPLAMAARFSSSCLLAFGIVMILLCLDPVRFRLLLSAPILFGVRLINNEMPLGTIEHTFDLNRGRLSQAETC